MSNPALSKFNEYQPQPQLVYANAGAQYGNGYVQQGYAPQEYPQQQYLPTNPPMYVSQMQAAPARMTVDDVMTKSGLMLGLVILVAAISFSLLPMYSVMTWVAVGGASLAGFIVSFIVLSRRVVPAGGAVLYAVIEGFFVGAMSKAFESAYPGIIAQAVLGTFGAAIVTVGAVKVFKIKHSKKFSTIVSLMVGAYALAMLLNIVVSLFGRNMGLIDGIGTVSVLGALMVGLGTVLAVMSLVDDITTIQRGVDAGVPSTESWRAAMGLTITLVWLYLNILRILSYIRD